jgi:hypothetical protein
MEPPELLREFMAGLQCICGSFIIFHGEVSGEFSCPGCLTKWSEHSVTLFNGTTYRLEENGRWVRGQDKPKHTPIPVPVSRFLGGEENV